MHSLVLLVFCLVIVIGAVYGGEEEHWPAPHYKFGYSVHDYHTGDIKSQHEAREGDVVHGFYSLVEPDGHVRTVKYNADHHHGFNAVVDRHYAYHPKPHKPHHHHHR